MSALITLKGVSKSFPNGEAMIDALRNVDFELHPGELVALTGRSGSGKSTLLNVCGGIDRADVGAVDVAGRSLVSATPTELAEIRRDHLGIVFQQLNLIPSLTAAENVALPLELGGERVRSARSKADEALASVGLGDRPDHFPDQLSGGERQRVAIARAIVGTKRIILADEPTGALDERSGDQILELLRAQADAGLAVLIVTHDRALAGLADRVVDLRDGAISSVVERPGVDLELTELWS